MKILMIRMAPYLGGAEIYNLNLIKGFKKYYPAVGIFFITNLPEFAKKIEAVGGKAFILPVFSEEVGTKRGLIKLFLALPKYLCFFIKTTLFLRIKKDVKIAVFQGTTEKIVLTSLLTIFNIKIIWLEHGPFFTYRKAKLISFLYKLLAKFTNKIITASYGIKKDLVNNGINPKKIISISTAIDTEYFSSLLKEETYRIEKELKIKEDEKVIGYTGAISEIKGINDFLKIADLLIQKLKNVKFFLVGSGVGLNKAKRSVNKKGIKMNFIFTGFQEDVKPYLGVFDLFLFPTRHYEASSLSILEAMAMGIPVVARDIGGNRELVVHGKTGYLFKNETPEELADIIIDLLKNKKKRETMGKAARKRIVKYFNEKRWITKLHQVFEEVARK